jgi:predicted patatin/cPLA2 family phospholipase
MNQKTVLELIADRMFARNIGVALNDGMRLCLAVEGGAMRGILSAGMLIALHDLNMLDLFDDFVGVSAGSLNLAYTLADQGALGISVYFEDMNDKDIVNLLRFRSKEHPIMDMRKLYDHTTKNKRLDIDRLKEKYSSSLKVTVTNVTQNTGELMTLDNTGERFEEFLTAGALLPFIAGEPWIINNQEYYDGSLHYIDPAQAAVELGSTHALILNTRYQDHPLKPWNKIIKQKFKSLDKNYPGAGTHYLESIEQYLEKYGSLNYGETEMDGTRLYRHSLPHSAGVSSMTMDTEKLVEALKIGYQSIVDVFYQQGKVGILPTLM